MKMKLKKQVEKDFFYFAKKKNNLSKTCVCVISQNDGLIGI